MERSGASNSGGGGGREKGPPAAAVAPNCLGVVKKYRLPAALFAIGLVFQLFVLPASFPPSHYQVLGLPGFATIEEIAAAYQKLLFKWDSGAYLPTTKEFIKIRYAFELLSNPLWKRDYDLFGIDEYMHIVGKSIEQYDGAIFSNIDIPLINISLPDTNDAFNVLTTEGFISKVSNSTPLLVQVFSNGSLRCARFLKTWKRIAASFDGVAEAAMVELGEFDVASYLAERKPTKQPFFLDGVPALVAFPPNCKRSDCYVRYQGDLSEYEIVDWMATARYLSIAVKVPSWVPDFIAKTAKHKVKVIYFSETGVRLDPFLRQAAQDYWAYASFASVFWREEDSSIWWNLFQVESAPSMVFLKDPGPKPFVHHGSLNSSLLTELMENNKQFELPQLRSMTSLELGCDAKGHSRAGNDTTTWYCVILAGRPSLELNKMRETMRSAQAMLRNAADSDNISMKDFPLQRDLAVSAFEEKRLTFAWLDGETQKDFCYFYLHSENVYETCGPRRYGDPTDVPRLFIVRYKKGSEVVYAKTEKRPKNIWDTFQEDDANYAAQLVARYNGSEEVHEIIEWISKTVGDGETRDLPDFVGRTPELIPEESDPIWSKGAQNVFSAGKGVKHWVWSIGTKVKHYTTDPRLGPAFLLGACLSFGTIWLQGTQTQQPAENIKDQKRKREHPVGDRNPRGSSQDRPSSITDFEPKDAAKMFSSGSDSD